MRKLSWSKAEHTPKCFAACACQQCWKLLSYSQTEESRDEVLPHLIPSLLCNIRLNQNGKAGPEMSPPAWVVRASGVVPCFIWDVLCDFRDTVEALSQKSHGATNPIYLSGRSLNICDVLSWDCNRTFPAPTGITKIDRLRRCSHPWVTAAM